MAWSARLARASRRASRASVVKALTGSPEQGMLREPGDAVATSCAVCGHATSPDLLTCRCCSASVCSECVAAPSRDTLHRKLMPTCRRCVLRAGRPVGDVVDVLLVPCSEALAGSLLAAARAAASLAGNWTCSIATEDVLRNRDSARRMLQRCRPHAVVAVALAKQRVSAAATDPRLSQALGVPLSDSLCALPVRDSDCGASIHDEEDDGQDNSNGILACAKARGVAAVVLLVPSRDAMQSVLARLKRRVLRALPRPRSHRIMPLPRHTLREFVGRSDDITALATAVERCAGGVVNIHGDAGMGKTMLVRHWLAASIDAFDTILWLRAGSRPSLAGDVAVAAEMVSGSGGATTLAAVLETAGKRCRQPHRCLAVLDGVTSATTCDVQQACSRVPRAFVVVITSRTCLSISDTEQIVVRGMYTRDAVATLAPEDAAATVAAASVARMLDASPLALRLAANLPVSLPVLAQRLAGLSKETSSTAAALSAAQPRAGWSALENTALSFAALLSPSAPVPVLMMMALPGATARTWRRTARALQRAGCMSRVDVDGVACAAIKQPSVAVCASLTRHDALRAILPIADRYDWYDPATWPEMRASAPHVMALAQSFQDAPNRELIRLLDLAGYFVSSIDCLYSEAQAMHRLALDMSEALSGVDAFASHKIMLHLGKELYWNDQVSDAKAVLERTLAAVERKLGVDAPESAETLRNLALLQLELDDSDQARLLLLRSRDACLSRPPAEQELAPNRRQLALTLSTLADVIIENQNEDEGKRMRDEAKQMRIELHGPRHFTLTLIMRDEAWDLMASMQYDQALEVFRETLEIVEAAYGSDHVEISMHLIDLAICLANHGKYDAAVPYCERAVRQRQRVYGHVDYRTAYALMIHGWILGGDCIGDDEAAEPLLLQSWAGYKARNGPVHANNVEILTDLCDCLLRLNKNQAALPIARLLWKSAELGMSNGHAKKQYLSLLHRQA